MNSVSSPIQSASFQRASASSSSAEPIHLMNFKKVSHAVAKGWTIAYFLKGLYSSRECMGTARNRTIPLGRVGGRVRNTLLKGMLVTAIAAALLSACGSDEEPAQQQQAQQPAAPAGDAAGTPPAVEQAAAEPDERDFE